MIIINNDLTKYVLNDGKASVYNAMQYTCVGSLGREDFLEKEMATHSSTLA